MSSNRHLARVIALQTLYEYEFRTHSGVEGLTSDLDEILARNLAVYTETMEDDSFARDLANGAFEHQAEADALIAPAAPEWPIEQIAKMDLTILRLAIYELMIKREVPPKVVINEAVELAKSFGGDNSSRFINGVLGTIYRQSEFYDPTEDHKVQREQSASPGKKAKASPQRSTSSPTPEGEPADQPDSGQSDSQPDQAS
jgi:transcription antitermination protein NusB